MKFLSYQLSNVFSIDKAVTTLSDRGLVLINGHSLDEGSSNGSGKSSLVNKGLLWLLYGQTAEGIKGDEVINRWINKPAGGDINFIGEDGNRYWVFRMRSKGKSTLKIECNGEDVSTRDVRTTQDIIDKVLGRDLKTFIQTEFFGQGNSAPFLKLTSQQQKELLESILPMEQLNTWTDSSKLALALITRNKQECEKLLHSRLAVISALNSQYISYNNTLKEWEKIRKETVNQLEDEIKIYASSPAKKRIEELQKVTEGYPEVRVNNLMHLYESHIGLLNTHEKDKQRLSGEQLVVKSNLEHAEKRLSKLKTSECPECEQKIENWQDKWNKIHEEVSKLRTELSRKSTSFNMAKQNIFTTTQIIDECKEKIDIYQCAVEQLTFLKSSEDTINMEKAKEKKKELLETTNPHVAGRNKLQRDISTTKIECTKLESKIKEIDKEVEDVEFWKNAFKVDIRNVLFDKVCPYIENRTNYHLSGLGNSQISVKISTDKLLKSGDTKREFDVSVSSTSGGTAYHLLSGGEQQLVDFAMGLALSDLANLQVKGKSNLLILDEPFIGLDAKNSENLVNYLSKDILKNKETILLVSNEESLKGLIPNKLIVIKKDGISTLGHPDGNT